MPNIKAKNYYGEYVRRENVNKVLYESADEEGVKIPFTHGEAVSKEVELDFSSGDNMEVPIAEGELVTGLTIVKPKTLVPELIADGEYIAGIGPGTHKGTGEDAPQLYAPTIAGLLGSGSQYVTVTNPTAKNGVFATSLKISVGESTERSDVLYDGDLASASITLYGKNFELPENLNTLTTVLGARLLGSGFNASEAALTSVAVSILRITYQLNNLSISPQHSCAFLNDSIQFQLTAADGYYLPKTVENVPGVYDPDTGILTVTFDELLDTGYVIAMEASTQPWLQKPTVILNSTAGTLTVTFPVNSTGVAIVINDSIVVEVARDVDQSSAVIDLSESLASFTSCAISVVATASGYDDSDSVDFWYMPSLVEINIANNAVTNIGTGGSTYNASLLRSGYFSGGKFIANSTGALSIPTSFMRGSSTKQWTIAWAVDKWTPSSSAYSRFARGNADCPSIFYTYSAKTNLFKLTNKTVFLMEMSYYDPDVVAGWGGSSSNAASFDIPRDAKTVLAFRNDGTYISLWMNGKKIAEQLNTTYTSSYQASSFTLGNGVSNNSYNMSYMECSMFKAWDRALTDSEMIMIQ